MRALPALLLVSSSVLAQSTTVIFHSTADLDKARADLLATARKAPTGVGDSTLDAQDTSKLLLIVRVHSGEAELHREWADQIIIQSGSMTVVTGGTITAQHPYGTVPGEFRGSKIEGGTEHLLRAGETLRIPPGLPHWARLAPGQTVTYFAVKEKK